MMPAPSPSVDEVARLADGLVKLRNINPVALAVWKGDAQLLEELLERLGDGPTRNSNEAGENNSVEPGSVASWDRMVDPSKGDLSSGDTALQLAFRLGNLRAAMRLLDAGALVNARGRGPHQFAPVQHALYFTSAKMLENNPGVQDALAFADEESFTQGKPLMARPAYANDPKAAPLPLPTRRALNLGEHVARRCIMLTNERAKEKWLTDKQPRLSKALRDLPDFAFALKFNVRSWIPLLGRVLPKDTCHVWKVGSRIRLDCTLAGFESLSWKRGHLSFIYFGDGATKKEVGKDLVPGSLIVLDRRTGRWADLVGQLLEAECPEDMEEIVASTLASVTASVDTWSRDVEIKPRYGWLSRKAMTATVGEWDTKVYAANNFRVRVDIRSAPQPQRHKRYVQAREAALDKQRAERKKSDADASPHPQGDQGDDGDGHTADAMVAGEVLAQEGKEATDPVADAMVAGEVLAQGGKEATDPVADAMVEGEVLAQGGKEAEGKEAEGKEAADGKHAEAGDPPAVSSPAPPHEPTPFAVMGEEEHVARGKFFERQWTVEAGATVHWMVTVAAYNAEVTMQFLPDEKAVAAQEQAARAAGILPSRSGDSDGDGDGEAEGGAVLSSSSSASSSASSAPPGTAAARGEGEGEAPNSGAGFGVGAGGTPSTATSADPANGIVLWTGRVAKDGAEGEHDLPCAGTLTLRLSNHYAYWHTKTCRYNVHVRYGDRVAPEAAKMSATPAPEQVEGKEAGGEAGGEVDGGGCDSTMQTCSDACAVGGETAAPMVVVGAGGGTVSFEDYFGVSHASVERALAGRGEGKQREAGREGEGKSRHEDGDGDGGGDGVEGKSGGDDDDDDDGSSTDTVLPRTREFVTYPKVSTVRRKLSATIHMTKDFPLPVLYLLPVAEIMARTSRHFENVNRFLHTKLPPGFPVKFDVPIMPTLSATVEFVSATLLPEDDCANPARSATDSSQPERVAKADLFAIPEDFVDATHLHRQGRFFDSDADPTEEPVNVDSQ